MGEVDLGWLSGVVARHSPALYLHPADRYMPCSAEFFLRHSELRLAAAGAAGSARLLHRGSVAAPLLLEAQRAAPPGARLWLDLDPDARPGMPLDRLADVPLYAHAKAVLDHQGAVEAIEVTYITLYAYNGAYRVGGVGLLQTGAHDGDWEHCTARVHPVSGELLGMWYNAHRSRDGCWVAGPEVPRDPQTGRVAAYVALHGHGTYPQPGRVLRHFFLGNDLCSGDGPVWRPRRVVLLPPLHSEGGDVAAGGVPVPIGEAAHGGAVQLDQAPAEGGEDCGGQPAAVEAGLQGVAPGRQSSPPAGEGAGGADSGSGAAGVAPRRLASRRLVQVLSRGSSLSSLASDGPAGPVGGDVGAPASRGGSQAGAASRDVPEVATDEPCEWLFFRGEWGTIDAPICQPWFHRAEPPLSRTRAQRLFGHFVPEPA